MTRRPLGLASTPNPPSRHTRTESTRLGDVKPGEIAVFIIVQLSDNGQCEIVKRIQVAVDINLASSLILYNVDLFQSSKGQV